ncbi:MAG: hypothetical protein ACI9EW_001594 [Cellvibrionaceae bacterium]|jgi:hypothetical protein
MPKANYEVGKSFHIHFVWKLPNEHYIRALFKAVVLDIDLIADRYLIRLQNLLGKKEEDEAGNGLVEEMHTEEYWQMVYKLISRKAHVAFEVDDGRPLYLRLPTLTLEHKFFTRYSELDDDAGY